MSQKPKAIIAHWSTMIEGLNVPPSEFFDAVETAVSQKNMPKVKFSRYTWSEGGLLSAKREYLRIKRKDHAYDVCGAPFGNGFFVSTWLGDFESGLLGWFFSLPVIGVLAEKMFKPVTYYQTDTALMYQSLVHSAVLEAVDSITKTKGLRALPESERKPEMRNFFGQ